MSTMPHPLTHLWEVVRGEVTRAKRRDATDALDRVDNMLDRIEQTTRELQERP